MRELEILETIEQTPGSKAKEKLLSDNVNNERLQELLNMSLNFFIKFHIKKIEVFEFNQDNQEDKHGEFMLILQALKDRLITGNQAKSIVENFLKSCNILQQKWYTRVIQKDLKIGCSITTVNKCGFKIPKFDVMLAKDAKKMKKAKSIVERGVFVSPKLDGYRCLCVWDGEEVQLLSRNGSHYENFPSVHQALLNTFKERDVPPVILDGEIMSDNFQAMQQSAFASVRGSTVGDVIYHIFGFVSYQEWVEDDFKQTTKERLAILEEDFWRHLCDLPNVKLVPQTFTNDWEDILTLEAKYLQQGLEGAMALPADMPYYKGRKTNALMKFKTFHTMDCIVEDFDEGTGKNQGNLGAIRVRQEDGQTICGVGSGFTDDERTFIWGNKEKIRGRIAEIRYQELTEDGVMRFPTFVRWRDQGPGLGKI